MKTEHKLQVVSPKLPEKWTPVQKWIVKIGVTVVIISTIAFVTGFIVKRLLPRLD